MPPPRPPGFVGLIDATFERQSLFLPMQDNSKHHAHGQHHPHGNYVYMNPVGAKGFRFQRES